MIKSTWVAILFFSASVGADVRESSSVCDLELQKTVTVAVNLTRKALQEGLLKVEELAQYLSVPTSEDDLGPLSSQFVSIDNLDLRKATARLFKHLNSEGRTELRRRLSEVLRERESEDKVVRQGQEATTDIVSLKLARQLVAQFPIVGTANNKLNIHWLDNRPVFSTAYSEHRTRSWQHLLFDPFNPDSGSQVQLLQDGKFPNFKGNLPQGRMPAILRINGRLVFVSFGDLFIYDLESKTELPLSFLGIESLANKDMVAESFMLTHTRLGLRVWLRSSVNLHSELFEFNLTSPDQRGGTSSQMGYHFVEYRDDERHLLIGAGGGSTIRVQDLNLSADYSPASLATSDYSGSLFHLYPFEEEGKVHLAFVLFENPESWLFGRADLESGKMRWSPRYSGKLNSVSYLKQDGAPQVVAFSADPDHDPDGSYRTVGNLQTMEFSRAPSSHPFAFETQLFRFQGRDLSIGRNGSGQIFVYDFEIDGVQTGGPKRVQQFTAFEYQGRVYALVAFASGLPYVLEVIGPERLADSGKRSPTSP